MSYLDENGVSVLWSKIKAKITALTTRVDNVNDEVEYIKSLLSDFDAMSTVYLYIDPDTGHFIADSIEMNPGAYIYKNSVNNHYIISEK